MKKRWLFVGYFGGYLVALCWVYEGHFDPLEMAEDSATNNRRKW